MKDPICGMTGTIERHGHWFCSDACVAEFERRGAKGRDPGQARWRRLLDPWLWAPLSALLLATAGSWWSAAAETSAIYLAYLEKMGLPLLLGLVLGGFIDHFVPKEYIIKLLSGPRKRVILRSTLLGFLASTCSHGCLALTIELYRKGASVPAVVSFLLASPWASMSLTLILLGLFGVKGMLFIAASLLIAVITGLIFQRLDRRGLIDSNPHSKTIEPLDLRADVAARWRAYPRTAAQLASDALGVARGMVPLGRMVLGWVQLGLILSAVLGAVVPHSLFDRYLGPSAGGLLLTLAFAAVVEVCSEGTAPLAYEIYRHTGAFGNAFAFLMGGVVTDYTELGAVWVTIGRRTVLWLLAVTLPLVFGLGLILNALSV